MMTSLKKLAVSGMTLSALVAVACGGTTPPPSPPNEIPPPSVPSDAAAPSATVPAAPPPSETAAPASDSAASAPKPVAIAEPKDECTPVGVDFEKRARPKLKECYATGKKKDPSLEGTVKVRMTVDVKGKIKSVKVVEKTLPDPVADCMLKVVKTTPFPEVEKCWDATLTIPITFPTPH